MKSAIAKTGEPITASASAPTSAICPYCGGTLQLRRRRLMGGGRTYFWRHPDNGNLRCPRRSRRSR